MNILRDWQARDAADAFCRAAHGGINLELPAQSDLNHFLKLLRDAIIRGEGWTAAPLFKDMRGAPQETIFFSTDRLSNRREGGILSGEQAEWLEDFRSERQFQ